MKKLLLGAVVVALGLTLPAHAEGRVGAGTVAGTLTYGGPGAATDADCHPTAFEMALSAELVLHSPEGVFTGSAAINGRANSRGMSPRWCEGGYGSMTFSVLGTDLDGDELHCQVFGWWSNAVGNGFTVIFLADDTDCTINGSPLTGVQGDISTKWVPQPSPDGTIGSAVVAGQIKLFDEIAEPLTRPPADYLPEG